MANLNIRRRSGFIQRGGVMRRESLWLAVVTTATGLATASTAAIINTLNAAGLALRPFTVVRTRGTWLLTSDQAVASESFAAGIAACVVSDQAAAIGVTAVPTPVTDKGSDLFFMYDWNAGGFSFGTNIGFGEERIVKDYDSRAMRKVNEDQEPVFVIENDAFDGLLLTHSARMLIKLH